MYKIRLQQTKKLWLVMMLLAVAFTGVSQQNFPIKTQAIVTNGSVLLSDYTLPQNVRALVSLSDVNEVNYKIILKVRFFKDGFNVSSKTGIPLTLQGGETYTLNQVELEQLFLASDLDFSSNQGVTSTDQQIHGRTIPEGTYTMILEALDASTKIVVSNTRVEFTNVIVQQYDPPLVSMPSNGTIIKTENKTSSINFSWTPRSIGLSASTNIKYNLKIVEVFPVTRNPYDALKTEANPLATYEGIVGTSQIYDPSALSLEEGKTYAWQVEAYEERPTGVFKGRFRNQGLSEAFTFKVEETCEEIGEITIAPETQDPTTKENLIALSWSKEQHHKGYQLSYREAGTIKDWQIIDLKEEPSYTFSSVDLSRGQEYEYVVQARCKSWLDQKKRGRIKLAPKPCEAPSPLYIVKKEEGYVYLEWTPSVGATSYEVWTDHTSLSGLDDEGVIAPAVAIEQPTTELDQPFKIRVDAHCASEVDQGVWQTLNFEEDDLVVGDCPLPQPFELFVEQSPLDETKTILKWSSFPKLHKSFVLNYWNSSDPTATTEVLVNSPNPTTELSNLVRGQLYYYTVKAVCSESKTVTTKQGGFRVEQPEEVVQLNQTTANCFPPKHIGAEVKNSTTAKFEWSKVDDAFNYDLIYTLKATGETKVFNTTATHARLKDLETGVYEYKVVATCDDKKSVPTKTAEINLNNVKEKGPCDSLNDFEFRNRTASSIQVGWTYKQKDKDENETHTGFILEHKEKGQVWAEAYTEELNNISELNVKFAETEVETDSLVEYTISSLKGGKEYDIRITAKCGLSEALANEPLHEFTDPAELQSCTNPDACSTEDQNPIALKMGDVITIHTLDLTIEELEKDGGGWSGKGEAKTYLLGIDEPVRMKYTFEKVKANASYCVFESGAIDASNVVVVPDHIKETVVAFSDKIDMIIDKAKEGADFAASLTGGAKTFFDAFTAEIDTSAYADFTPKELFLEGVKLGDQAKNILEEIADDQANILKGAEAVRLTKLSAWLIKKAIKDGYQETKEVLGLDAKPGYVMTFSGKSGEEEYFDDYETHKKLKEYYQQVDQLEGDKYVVPHVAVEKGKTREVMVTFTSPTAIQDDKVYFVTTSTTRQVGADVLKDQLSVDVPAGDRLTYTKVSTGVYKVTVPSDKGHVYAMYAPDDNTKHRLGKLNIIEIAPITKKLVIVSNGNPNFSFADASAIQTELNEVYKVAGVTFEVEFPRHNFRPSKFENGLKVSDEKLMSRYSASMKAYRKAFEEAGRNLESDKYYLFVVDKLYDSLAPSKSIEGFMPRNKQYGFISAEFNVTLNTIAHEYGHGIFTLEHTWDVDKGQPKESTQNLMDYNGGSELIGAQWKRIQNPGWQPYALDKKEDGSSVVISNIAALKPFKKGGCYSFISPASLPISVPSTIKSVEFFDEKEAESTSGEYHPLGALRAFTLANGKRFVAGYDFSKDLFNGYYDHKNKKWYIDELTKTEPSGDLVIVGRTKVKESKYYIELYQKEFDKNYVPGLTGWPTTTNYKASGEIGLNQYYFRLDGLLTPLKKEYLISSITYSAGKTQVLSLVNGLSYPESIYQVVYLGKKAAIFPSDFYDFVVCKGFEKYEDYVARVKRQDEDKTRSSIDSDYAEYLKQKKNDFYAFVNGQGKSSHADWLTNAKTKWKDNNTTSYSETKQIIDDAKCLTISYTKALESLPFKYRRNAIRILRKNSNEDHTRDLLIKTPLSQKDDEYAYVVLEILAEFADDGDYDEEYALEMLNLMGRSADDKCNAVTYFVRQLLSPRAGGKCIFQGLIHRYSDVAFDNDKNFRKFFTQLCTINYLRSNRVSEINKLKLSLGFKEGELDKEIVFNSNQAYSKNVFIWNGSAATQIGQSTNIAYSTITNYHQYKVEQVDCGSFNLLEGKKTTSTSITPFGTSLPVSHFKAEGDPTTLAYFSDWIVLVDIKNKQSYAIPGMWAYFLISNEDNLNSQMAVQIAINVAGVVTGSASIAAGAKGIQLVIAIAEVSSSMVGITTLVFEKELKEALGEDGFAILQAVNNIVGIAGMSLQSGSSIATKVQKLCSTIDKAKDGSLVLSSGLKPSRSWGNLSPKVKTSLETVRNKFVKYFPKLANAGGNLSHFLDDAFVLSKRAEVIADGLPAQFPNLSIDEITAIKVYTSDEVRNGVKIYSELNTQLRAGSNLDEYYQGLNKLLNDGLGKMTQHNGSLVFRGCGQAESQLAKTWKVGDEITFKDFKSSSVTENTAENFMNSGGGDVIYEISNPKGYNICDISCSPNEAEIFFKSGSKFNVDELTFQPRFTESDPIVKVIKLTYIP